MVNIKLPEEVYHEVEDNQNDRPDSAWALTLSQDHLVFLQDHIEFGQKTLP